MTLTVYPQLKWRAPESAALSSLEGSRNCAAASGAAMANFYLHGGDPVITHHDFRLKAGNPKDAQGNPQGLGTAQVDAALKAYGVPSVRYAPGDFSVAVDALKAGAVVGIAVHYPYINKNYPELSGQLTFRGEHFLCLYHWYRRQPHTQSNDPLYDGRCRTWGCAPKGPQRAPYAAYRGAMEEFQVTVNGQRISVRDAFGAGKGVFIIVPAPEVTP
jgi:hypothetical protein